MIASRAQGCEQSRREEAQRAVVWVSTLGMFGAALSVVAYASKGYHPWPWIWGFVAQAAVLSVALRWPRRAVPTQLALFALATSITVPVMWLMLDQLATRGDPFGPFVGHKLLVVGLALLAPAGWLGAVLIVATAAAAFAQAYLAWSPEIRDRMPDIEPLQTALVATAAMFILAARRRFVQVVNAAAQAEARSTWLRRAAHIALEVRDRTNSPLQILKASMPLLREQCADLDADVGRMERALDRLTRLNAALAPLDRVAAYSDPQLKSGAPRRIAAQSRGTATFAKRPARLGAVLGEALLPLRRALEIDPASEARYAALQLGLFCVAAGLVGIAVDRLNDLPTGNWLVVVAVGLCSASLALTLPGLRRSVGLSLTALQAGTLAAATWIAQGAQVANGRFFTPFNATKLVMLAIALTAASETWGGVLLGLTALVSVLQYLTWPEGVRDQLLAVEPLMTLVFAALALALLSSRRRQARRVRELARARARQCTLRRLNRLSMMVRELANTPLQTLRFTSALVRRRGAGVARIVDRIDRSLDQLEQLNGALGSIDRLNEWRSEELAFDAFAQIERELRVQLGAAARA